MNDWSFLRSRRWAGYLALVVVFAIASSALGVWQLNRRAEALAEVARIDANYDAEAVPVSDALPDPAAFDIDQRWLVVALSGEYLADEEVVVRNRPFAGSSGFEVITCGPGWMPLIVIAPTMSAITGLGGMPRVSIGMNEVWAPALLALSGPATPRMSPRPNLPSAPAIFFSIETSGGPL